MYVLPSSDQHVESIQLGRYGKHYVLIAVRRLLHTVHNYNYGQYLIPWSDHTTERMQRTALPIRLTHARPACKAHTCNSAKQQLLNQPVSSPDCKMCLNAWAHTQRPCISTHRVLFTDTFSPVKRPLTIRKRRCFANSLRRSVGIVSMFTPKCNKFTPANSPNVP
jgi:hypothetical protein